MRVIKTSSKFRKELKKIANRTSVISEVNKVIGLLASGQPIPKDYKDHALTGNWAGFRDLHVAWDVVLIYSYLDDGSVQLERIGSHSNIFK